MKISDGTPDAARMAPRRFARWRRVLSRLLLACAGGVVLYLSYAPRDLWWLAPLAFTVLGLVLHGRRFWPGVGYGLVFGLAFYLAHLMWIQDFLGDSFGPTPWLALSGVLALYAGLACGLMTLVARFPAAPVWMAAVFLLQESARTWWPLGGFPWGRVGFSQPEGAFLPLASVGGAPLVGFAVLVSGFGLAALLLRARASGWRPGMSWGPATAAALIPVVAGLAVWPTVGSGAEAGSRTVAIVQGNAPDIGLELLGAREVLRANHLEQTRELLADVRAGRVPRPDIVVWPETATEFTGNAPELGSLVSEFGVPFLVGAVTHLPGGRAQNSVLLWRPGEGPVQRYAKQQLVPYAEFVPMRTLASWFTPFVGDTADMKAGDEPGVFDVAGTEVGVGICYEAAYDYVTRGATVSGARLLVLPTNNAWFGPGEMSYQQLSMSRLRAVEHGRAVVVAATSGVSAMVRPDGSVAADSELFTAASLVQSVPLRTEATLADQLGAWTEYVLIGIALAALGACVGGRLWHQASRHRAGEDRAARTAGGDDTEDSGWRRGNQPG